MRCSVSYVFGNGVGGVAANPIFIINILKVLSLLSYGW